MAAILTAKQILLSYDISSPTNDKGENYRGTAFEFQDYAYRLAKDLNDLEHLQIYMRLTKQYPRHLLDRTYESIADINEFNKGRLFMWKFKQVRKELQKNKDIKDYSYDHVISKMKDTRNNLSDLIIRKHNDIEKNILIQFLTNFKQDFTKDIKKILVVGLSSSLLVSMFEDDSRFIYGIDVSKNITNSIKSIYKNKKRRFFITKDFLSSNYKIHQFDLVIFSYYWEMIPLMSEPEYLKQVQRLLKPKGNLYLTSNISGEDQEWKILNKGENEQLFFSKSNNQQNLEQQFDAHGFSVLNSEIKGDNIVYRLEHSL